MSGSRQKKIRAQNRAGGVRLSPRPRMTEMRAALMRQGSRRTDREIAIWLTKAVWRQQSGATCIEATAVLSNALTSFGIANRVVPVGVITQDAVTHRRNGGGEAAVRLLRSSGELPEGEEVRRPEGGPDFFVDGAHAVVVCEGLDLLLDPTLDQFGVTGVPMLTAALSLAGSDEGWTWQFAIGEEVDGRQSTVRYVEVGDEIALERDLPFIIEVSARELAAVAVVVDFGDAALDADSPLYLSVELLIDVVSALDRGDRRPLDLFRRRRAAALAAKGFHDDVPEVWALGPAEDHR